MNKRIISIVFTLVLLLSCATTPTYAATKASTKTIVYQAGKHYEETYLNDYATATVKVTNVTSQKTKDFSLYMSDDKVTISGKKSKVIYCTAPASITLQPNKGDDTAIDFGFMLYFDSNKVKPSTVKSEYKYYPFYSETEEVDTSKKYDKAPEDFVIADGSSVTMTKAGTYVLYVRPFQFYGTEQVDYELTPIFIVVKK